MVRSSADSTRRRDSARPVTLDTSEETVSRSAAPPRSPLPPTGDSRPVLAAEAQSWPQHLHSMRGPAWRMELACQHAAGANAEYRDPYIDAAADYLRHEDSPNWGRKQERLQPSLFAAMALERDSVRCAWARLLVLADVSRQQAADKLGTTVSAVNMWERLFLDLSGKRQAVFWVDANVFLPVEKRGEKALGLKMRRAFFGGPEVVWSLLEMEKPIEPTAPPLDRLDQLIARVSLQAEIAMASAPNTPQGLKHILQAAVRLRIAEPEIALAIERKKYLEMCGEKRDRELADLRQQLDAALAELEELRRTAADTRAPAAASPIHAADPRAA